jgi:hypothetical protein
MRKAEVAERSAGVSSRRPGEGQPDASPAVTDGARWLVLIHHLPPKPDYFRVKVRRRLQRLGAVALKNAVYVLPRTDASMEDFEWLLHEIAAEGGEALLCAAAFLDGVTDPEIEGMFNRDRDADYDAIAEAATQLARVPWSEAGGAAGPELVRLRRRLDEATALDHFGAPRREAAVRALAALEARSRPGTRAVGTERAVAGEERPLGRTWVTREGVFVDRIASAWLIRRFIDPAARFRFVAPQGDRLAPGELRFDMFEAEYTHEGDNCTFETLLQRFDLDDPALAQIAEIVHEIDLRDGKFARDDVAGIERVLAGIAATTPADEARLERGAVLFDGLYAVLAARGGA